MGCKPFRKPLERRLGAVSVTGSFRYRCQGVRRAQTICAAGDGAFAFYAPEKSGGTAETNSPS